MSLQGPGAEKDKGYFGYNGVSPRDGDDDEDNSKKNKTKKKKIQT
jgi:hypothetical protein